MMKVVKMTDMRLPAASLCAPINAAGSRMSLVVIGAILAAGFLPAQTPHERALLDKYCVTCHNSKTKIAGLTLDKMDLSKVPDNAETWEKVIKKLRTGAMPPLGMPKPDKASVDEFLTWL